MVDVLLIELRVHSAVTKGERATAMRSCGSSRAFMDGHTDRVSCCDVSHGWQVLAREFDHVEWDPRTDAELESNLDTERPMWLRIANFFSRNLSLLRLAPPGQMVLWKLEHWGSSTIFDRVPATPGLHVPSYTDQIFELGHHIVPYTFTKGNRDLLQGDIARLSGTAIDIVPIAQKPVATNERHDSVRPWTQLNGDDVVLGAGGLLHPAKGLEELATWFLRSCRDPRYHLLCSVIPENDDEITAESIRARWERVANVDISPRLHINVGDYEQWDLMCSFYRTVDAVLVNSVSDSWGRMVSEPVGLGTPTIARRAECATNEIVPDLVLVDSFPDLSWEAFTNVLQEARTRASRLAHFVNVHYGRDRVRKGFLSLLRNRTPEPLWNDFDRLAARPHSIATVDRMLAY